MTVLLEAALSYAKRRRPVFPVGIDKKPLTEHGFKDATTNEDMIRRWWANGSAAGIATPTGGGLFVLDVDNEEALKALEAEYGPLPPTVEVVTPRPGRHVYLRGDVSNSRGALPDGIDVRGTGGYVLLPPSPHPNGVYEWRTAPDEEPIAPAPQWLLGLLNAARMNGAAPAIEGEIPAHQRNQTLASMAGTMRRRGFHEAAIAAALLATNKDRCKPPLSDTEVRKIARSVARYKPAEDAAASLEQLNVLLALDQAGKRIDGVRVFGRGSKAHVCLHLDDGSRIVLDPLGSCSSPAKLSLEVASQAGATPTLKTPDVLQAVKLFYLLGEHHDAGEIADRAWEFGAEYLRAAVIAEVDMNDQASRWQAFSRLDHKDTPTTVVLHDQKTGVRYVRTQWFTEYLRTQTGPGEPAALIIELERLGWTKAGSEGRIKATEPEFGKNLQWAFLMVPAGWEHR